MSKLILQPAGNPDARKHYNDTIKTPVNLEKISKYLSIEDHDTLKKIYPDNKCYIWGVTPKSSNITQWNKISDNDIALFARNNMIFSYGISCYKMISHDLAAYLWEYDKDGFTWEYIYFLKNITPLSYTYLEMNQAIGYKPKYNYRGFNVVDSKRRTQAINKFGLQSVVAPIDFALTDGDMDFTSTETVEGKKVLRYTTAYERDPKARAEALSIHGYDCIGCGLNFEEMYGDHGKGYIHVHHIKPLSESGETKIDPRTDLIPLCPNCHAMVHKNKNHTLSIDELKDLIK